MERRRWRGSLRDGDPRRGGRSQRVPQPEETGRESRERPHRVCGEGPGPGHHHGGHGGRRGHHARRVGPGDVRATLLLLLDEAPGHGYQLIQRTVAGSAGLWQPSPGSVYPALQLLEDEGLIRAEQDAGRRVFHLTPDGRAYVTAHRDELTATRAAVTSGIADGVPALRDGLAQVGAALRQVEQIGTAGQVAAARRLLDDTRRGIYRILAGDADGAADAPPPDGR